MQAYVAAFPAAALLPPRACAAHRFAQARAHTAAAAPPRARIVMRAPDSLASGMSVPRVGGVETFGAAAEEASESAPGAEVAAGGGGGGSGSGSGSGSVPGDRGSGGGDDELPEDVQAAFSAGVLTADGLASYRAYAASGNPLMRALVRIPACRDRMLADSAFMFKLIAQEVIGNGTCLVSEITERGREIVNEVEYVASDLIVGTVVEAAFVWILAPCMSNATASALRSGAASAPGGLRDRLSVYVQSLPASAFQAETAVQKFSTSMRAASFVYAGLQYAAIGLVAGVVGTAITYGLIEGRKRFSEGYTPERPMPPIFESSVGWAAFMAGSSNTRFQIVEGIERVMPNFLGGGGLKSGIIGLRLLNNYYGGVQFIQFFRFMGLQAVAE